MKITNAKLKSLSYCLSLLKITEDVSADNILAIVKLRKEIQGKAKDLSTSVEEVLKAYDLFGKTDEEVAKSENNKVANDKIKDLMSKEVELSSTNFLPMKEIRKSLDGLNTAQLELIIEYLVKE